MNADEVWDWIDDGLVRFAAREQDLDLKVQERALTGRLLVHLDASLQAHRRNWLDAGWKLDNEYSKVGRFNKRLPELPEVLDALEDALGWERGTISRRRTTRANPDLILHRRGSGYEHNAVVCEVKRSTENIEALAFDVGKLIRFRQYLNYEFAFLLLLGREHARCSILPVGPDVASGAALVSFIEQERTSGRVPRLNGAR